MTDNFFLEDTLEDFIIAGTKSTYNGGAYTDIGIGMRAKVYKKVNMIFSLGHSYKKIKNSQLRTICGIVPPCYEEISRYKHSYGRLILKMGIQL